MKGNTTLYLIGGAVVLFYLYSQSQAKATAAAYAQQNAAAQANQTSNYINAGVGVIDDLF
jgi:hypothetical protein